MRRRAATLLYAGYAWTFTGTVVFVTWISVALLPRFEWRWRVVRRALRLLGGATRAVCTIEGLNHLPPPDRSCVFVANHASYLDAYFLGAYLPRHPSFVAKVEFTRSFITRVFLTRIGTEFVERFDQHKGMADTQRLIQKVAAGHSLLFFPEGTFTRRPGLLPFHMGAFVVAAKAGVPVVPIAIRGTRSMLRSGSWLLRPGMASITIGPPIKIGNEATTTPADTWATALKLRAAAREYILRHCREPDLAHETDFQSLI
jgi:1-acyl-sn-glycerol-3-phosphate acyltransferase